MGSTTQPTHYEILGLRPTASATEIDQAFAREIGRPRAFGGLAQVGIAHATLRDPERRRAYDAAIGIRPEPAPAPMTMSRTWQIAASAHVLPATQAVLNTIRRPPAPPAPEPAPSFVAASLQRIADPSPLITQASATPLEPSPPAAPPAPVAEPLVVDEADQAEFDWRRPAIIGGGLTLAAVLFGAWAGSSVRDPAAEPAPLEAGMTMAVPAARDRAAAGREPQAAMAQAEAAEPAPTPRVSRPPARNPAAARGSAPMPRPVQLTPAEEQELAGGPFVQSATLQAEAAAEAIAEAPPAEAVAAAAAKLPLPGRTIARTIGRIGYACGSVSSVTPTDAPGVFKVTCASGDSYQARPVRGRYRFRRWGRQ